MRQNDTSAAQSCRVDDDVAHGHFDRFQLTIIGLEVEAAGVGVHMRHPQTLSPIISGMEA